MAGEDWQQCVRWLIDCQILTHDHRAAQPAAQLSDLAHALRDGVLVCLLLNRLRPKTLDPKDFSQRPQMSQFLCIKNIKVFLASCKKVFGLSDKDLFDPTDLFECHDIRKVITTLSSLSQTPVALSSKIAPFLLSNTTASNYINMNDLDDGEEDDDEEYYTIVQHEDDDDDVYGAYVAQKPAGSKITGDSQQQQAKFSEGTAPKSHRDMCIKELLDTEENYVKCLEMITQQFMKPLSKLLAPPDFKKIFQNVEKLCEIHQRFVKELAAACRNETNVTIADCFITNKEKFLIYGEYCSNLIEAQDLLDRLCAQTPRIQQDVNELQMKANEGRFKLRDLLSVPMQRVLKYHLLLKELIKHTEASDVERKSLQRALEETQDLSLFVNEVKRDNETLNALNLVQASISDLPLPHGMSLKDYGRMLMDGEIRVKSEKCTGQRHVFILDQLIIICKTVRGESHVYQDSLILKKYDLDESLSKDWSCVWFTMTDRFTKSTVSFGAKKEELSRKWISAIKMAMENMSPPFARTQLHDFAMHTFNEPTICDVCRKLLRGVFFQGYKCMKTKMAVHKECLEKAKNMTGPPVIPPKLPSRPSFRDPRMTNNRTLKGKVYAVSNYDGIPPPIGNRPALTFEKNEAIDLLSDDGDFWEGHLNGREGFFPRSFVQKRPDMSRQRRPPEQYLDVDITANGNFRHSDHGQKMTPIGEENLGAFEWYVGVMSREEATANLETLPDGTFLVRLSVNDARKGQYALSIKHDSQPKHIKIQCSSNGEFFLASCHLFNTIAELVNYYESNSLERLFPEVRTTLALPYKDAVQQQQRPRQSGVVSPVRPTARTTNPNVIAYCEAQYDYAATATNQISMKTGDIIGIISKAGEDNGWWKGENKGKVGYFPYAYVTEVDN